MVNILWLKISILKGILRNVLKREIYYIQRLDLAIIIMVMSYLMEMSMLYLHD